MHGRTVIRVEHNNVLVIAIMRGEIVKQHAEVTIHRLHLTVVDILTEPIRFQKDRALTILWLQHIRKSQMRSCICRGADIRIKGMSIRKVHEEEVIALIKCLEMAYNPLHSIHRTQHPMIHNQPVETTCCTIIDALGIALNIRAIVPQLLHLLGDRHIRCINRKGNARLCNLCMMLIQACLYCRKRRIGVLCRRKIMIENDSFGKELQSIRDELRCPVPYPLPTQSVCKDIQHEFPALRCVSKHNRFSNQERLLRCKFHGFLNAIKVELTHAEHSSVLRPCTMKTNHLV